MKLSSKTSFFLVSNYHTYGIQNALFDYLKKHSIKQILFLNHPLHGVSTDTITTLEITGSKKLNTFKRSNLPEAINYFIDLLITLKVGFSKSKQDVYIGFNSMNTLAGLFLKLFGRVTVVITYSHSYREKRYANPIINSFYKWIDMSAIRYSDSVWGLSDALSDIRKNQGVPIHKIVHAADGVDLALVHAGEFTQKKMSKLIFVGLINELNGLDLVIEAIPDIIAHDKNVSLHIIGDGEDAYKIKEKIKKMNIKDHIYWEGIKSMQEIGKILKNEGVGVATYKPLKDSTLKTTDPMKTKLYMAAGLPIISTDLYKTAHEIKDNTLGILIRYTKKDFIDAYLKLQKVNFYKKCRKNCMEFVKKYDWETIFTNAFNKTDIRL